jgi:hypothetical protein
VQPDFKLPRLGHQRSVHAKRPVKRITVDVRGPFRRHGDKVRVDRVPTTGVPTVCLFALRSMHGFVCEHVGGVDRWGRGSADSDRVIAQRVPTEHLRLSLGPVVHSSMEELQLLLKNVNGTKMRDFLLQMSQEGSPSLQVPGASWQGAS